MQFFKKILFVLFPKFKFCSLSYAQEGEDLVVARYFDGKRDGFYIDIGAHHPHRFSNTFMFYEKGWSGICIDPLPECATLFKKYRPRDIFVQKGVSDKIEILKYYMFNEPALNTFDKKLADERNGLRNYKIDKILDIDVSTFDHIMKDKNVNKKIDLLSIDIEGFDYLVLRSIDMDKYKPELIIVEIFGNFDNSSYYSYLNKKGYNFYARTGNSYIFNRVI
ncbi:FkbM family methyltransferase [Acinetobacter wuhouensis]|uniref:FkbM family methyltransferase n=1 Tax=Acinetobacter wuhouensis TaxID=1879050 RepID=A0A4V2DNJ4_9GAMM|nr:FkbM family methyltransferase [Acinetobacter wuhouensis]RZG49146.1 FkbM family methyltransferase [Acinetobacter wuhouensis]